MVKSARLNPNVNKQYTLSLAITISLVTLRSTTFSQTDPASNLSPGSATNQVQYSPPKSRSLGLRRQVNAGSRGNVQSLSVPVALVPDGLPLTTKAQPILWWYLTNPSSNKIEFTINRSFETIVKVELPAGTPAGLQKVDLAKVGKDVSVKLAPETPYEWTVRVKQGPDPAAHPVTLGWIEYRPPANDVAAAFAAASPAQAAAGYAARGYWYDSLNLLMQPRPDPRVQSLLDQVGLTNVIVFPR